jgi:enoyl-CoA hydratase
MEVPAMSYETIEYAADGAIATVTLNRPDKFNAIRPPMWHELQDAVEHASADDAIKVIVLQGAGPSFCAGFDFSQTARPRESDRSSDGDGPSEAGARLRWDPGLDMIATTTQQFSPFQHFMSLWRSHKPTIAKVHGYCVGGGSDMALCADLVVASEDARLGVPYARVWGCQLTGMWIYRLGLTRAKRYLLTGDWLDGKTAAEIGLINEAVPLEELDEHVRALAERLARIPATQLAAMKLIVNQAFENMGLHTTQVLGPILDGLMRNTPEGLEFVRVAYQQGVQAAVAQRDGPFGDYSQAPPEQKPKRRA